MNSSSPYGRLGLGMELATDLAQQQELTLGQLRGEQQTVDYFVPSHALHVVRDLVYRKLRQVSIPRHEREGMVRFAARDVVRTKSPALVRWMAEHREDPFLEVMGYLSNEIRNQAKASLTSVGKLGEMEPGTGEHQAFSDVSIHSALNTVIVGHTCNVAQLHVHRIRSLTKSSLQKYARHIAEVRGWVKDISRRTIKEKGPELLRICVTEKEETFQGMVEAMLNEIGSSVSSQCAQMMMKMEMRSTRT